MNSNQVNFQSSSKKAWCQPKIVALAVQSTAMGLAKVNPSAEVETFTGNNTSPTGS